MFDWVVAFLIIIALIAVVLGFGGISGASIENAIFFVAVILFLVSAVVGVARRRTRV